mgnify:CR=1 FL=1
MSTTNPSAWFTVRWSEEGVQLLDQRELPGQEIYLTLTSVEEVAGAMDASRNADDPVVFPVVPSGQLDHLRYSFGMASKD